MTMTDSITITPISHAVNGTVRPPGSKSLTNRALIVAALADGQSKLTGVLDSEDTRVMIDSLKRLGLNVTQDLAARTVTIEGVAGKPPEGKFELYLENSGTSIRFLTAALALGKGEYLLDGNKRMKERPIMDLVDALNGFGSNVSCPKGTGCPPVLVKGKGLSGGNTTVAGDVSSQFLSALLMASPCADATSYIELKGELVSRPYIDMTLSVMQSFGVTIDESTNAYTITPQNYNSTEYEIEPDASAASYFFALAAITGGSITVEGLSKDSLQGDVQFVDSLKLMGCEVEWNPNSVTVHGKPLKGIDIDMNTISDTAQTLACVAPFAEGPTRIHGVKHMRYKETDRITAVVTELRKCGLTVDEHEDGMTIHPGPIQPASIHTYNDHRMAMSFALLGLKAPGIEIQNPGCTAKTYPNYFEDLKTLIGA